MVQDDGPGPGGESREADVHQGSRDADFPHFQDSLAAGLHFGVHPDDAASRDYLQVSRLGDIGRRLSQDHLQGRWPGGRDGPLVGGILRLRTRRHQAGHAILQVIGRLEPYVARSDAVGICRIRDGSHGKPPRRAAGGRNLLLRQVRHKVQVDAFPGHDAGGFGPGELEEMRRRVRVVRPGQDDLDGLEQVPDDVEVRAHVRPPQIDCIAQVLVFPAGAGHLDRKVDVRAVPEGFEAEIFVHSLPTLRSLLIPLAVLEHVQRDGVAAPALLDLVQVLFGSPVVFHEFGRVVLSVVLDEEGHFRIGILYDDVHRLHMPSFLLDAGQVEPEVVLGIQLLDGDFKPVARRGQVDAFLDAGHRHPVSFRFQPFEFGGVPADEPERLQLSLFQARAGVGFQVQVAVIDNGVDIQGDAGRQGPAEVLRPREGGDGFPVLATGIGEDGARLRVEGEEGGFLEVLDFDVHDGPGAVRGLIFPSEADRDIDIAGLRARPLRLGLAAGGEGEDRPDEQCD